MIRRAPLKRTGLASHRKPVPLPVADGGRNAHPSAPKPARRPLRPVSAKRAALRGERAVIRQDVFDRDRGCLLVALDTSHRCFGTMTVHHLKKASAGGAYSMGNLVALCASGNSWVENEPDKATALGLVIRG